MIGRDNNNDGSLQENLSILETIGLFQYVEMLQQLSAIGI